MAEQVAQALIRRGNWRITAVSLISRRDLPPYSVIKTEKYGISNYLINVPAGRDYQTHYRNAQVSAEINHLISTLRPDLLHLHCIQEVGADILEVATARKLPVVLSVHDFWWICDRQFMVRVDQKYCGQNPVRIEACRGCVENYQDAAIRFDYLQAIGASADIITYPSQFALNLSEASGFVPGRGVVWENGVRLPEAKFFAAQKTRRTASPKLSFGFVGGPSEIKGWPIIRRAFANLKRSDFSVYVVDGSLDGSWWSNHDFSDLPGDWHIYPRFNQAEMDGFYAQIDVLLFMSQWKETFGLAVREALARGVRVIQTDSGGTVEHNAVVPEELIPIGSGPEPLMLQLEAALDRHPMTVPAYKVASFDDQAAAFETLVAPLLKRP